MYNLYLYVWTIVTVISFQFTPKAGENIIRDAVYAGDWNVDLYKSHVNDVCILRLLMVTAGVAESDGLDVTVKGCEDGM